MSDDVIRDTKGRFGPGNQANPAGRPKLTAAQKIERSLSSHGAEFLERAFQRAKEDDAVLAGLLSFLATAQGAANIAHIAAAQAPAARH